MAWKPPETDEWIPPGEDEVLEDSFAEADVPSVSKGKSFGKGALQGTTFGFADELGGVAGALTDKAASLIGGGPSEPFMDSYRRERDIDRAGYDAAKEANPGSYMGGEFTGAAATAFIPGGAQAKAAQAMKYAKLAKAGKLAAQGAVQGLGVSDADLTQGDVAGAAQDAATGGATNVAFAGGTKLLGWGAKKAIDTGKFVGKRALSAISGPSMEAIETRFSNPGLIQGAKPIQDIASEAASGAGRLSDEVSQLDDIAWSKLRTSSAPEDGAVAKDEVVSFLKRLRGKMEVTGGGTIGAADAKAANTLDKLLADIDAIGYKKRGTLKSIMGVPSAVRNRDYISESAMKQIIQAADRNIDWDDPAASKANEAIKLFRQGIDDRLKSQNPEYGAAMEPVAEKLRLLNESKKAMFLTPSEGGFAPSDTTMSKLDTILNEKKGFSRETIDEFGRAVGLDLPSDVRASRLAREFQESPATGSFTKKMLLGERGPVYAGNVVDKVRGVVEGFRNLPKNIDRFAERHGLDWLIKNTPERLGRFSGALVDAAKRGANQLAVANFVLQQRYPEYNEMISKLQDEGE